ncbi:MAG: sulfate ABC transporter substrate-binding protein [Solirubrobacterales bacterium]|nr:sulfate ABC transporter substrate-binding protein [Solirubrobacterales bacterium]MBV9942886.1 sulfate ABC transporter substrate-binding protein [Solirubrobacterales bacterium]
MRATAIALLSIAAVAVALAGCGGSSDATSTSASASTSNAAASSGRTTLQLVAYSTPKKAYDALTTAFALTSAGKGVSFGQSFGASGSQSRAVDTGQPADVVAFSTTPDMTRLVKAGIVAETWNANPYKGFSSNSVVVLVVRKGNPKHIAGWDDLIKPGVDVITPNPSTSGSARWNILAGYGAQLKEGKTPDQALAYIRNLLTKHVSVQDSSASAALQTFTGGKGDVLLDYESDALAAKKAGDAIDIVYPKQTLLIQTPIAVTAKSSHNSQAQAFVDWQWSTAGQNIWAKKGYRPVLQSVAQQFASKFPTPPQLFAIDYLGGWTKVTKEFFAPQTGSITKIEEAAGVPTAS